MAISSKKLHCNLCNISDTFPPFMKMNELCVHVV